MSVITDRPFFFIQGAKLIQRAKLLGFVLTKLLRYNEKGFNNKIIYSLMIKIRKASLKDLKTIYSLNVDLAKHELKFDSVRKKPQKKKSYSYGYVSLREKLKKRNYRFFIAEDQERPVGFIEGCIKKSPPFYKYSRRGEISPTFVKKEYRNKSIGKKLVKEMLSWFKLKGVRWIQLITHTKNINSINFWKKIGFKEYSIRMNLLLK